MATVFYSAVDGAVTKALDARKSYYASEDRSTGAHSWLIKKMAYVSATAKDHVNGKTASLSTPLKGGLARTNGSGQSSGGLYKGAGSRTKTGESKDARFIPRPHINNVKIGAEGDFGSILKCEISFAVYSLADLNAMQPFFDIGGEVGINYGWNQAGGAGGKAGKFQGTIYNFTYAVNPNGGFDCITYAMGPGINALSGNAKSTKDSKGESVTDETLSDVITHSNSIINKITNDCKKLPDLVDATDPATGIGAVKFETDWGNPPERTGDDAEAEKGEPETQYYVSLARIVALINEVLVEAGGPKFSKIKFICNAEITKGSLPAIDSFASANPVQVMFPGKNTYSETKTFTFGDIDSAFASNIVDLSLCMFNVKWLTEVFNQLGTETGKNQKSSDVSISALLKRLFDCVADNSANTFKLTVSTDPTDPTGNKLLIVDTEYIDSKISPYVITAVTQASICRSVSMQSRVPSEFATQAFVAAETTFTRSSGTASNILHGVTEAPPTDASTNEAPKLPDAMKAIGEGGVTESNVSSAQAAIAAAKSILKNPNGSIIIPVDFSCTLDGIEGFVFGNAITCNYLPSNYQQTNLLCFTVTKVEHNISGNDWTTTLSTVCRTIP